MNWFLRLCCLAVLAAVGARAAEHEILRTFPLPAGGALVVDSYRGDIVIEEGDDAEAKIALHFDYDVDTDAEAEKLWAGVKLQLRAEGNQVTIGIRNTVESGPRLSWQEKKRVIPHVRVVVPRVCNLTLSSKNGNITVGRVAGRMSAQVEQGTIFFRQVDGSITAQSQDGDIVVSRCSGDVSARALRGAVRVGTLGGGGNLRTANGDIEVMLAKAGLTAVADVGDISVGYARQVGGPATLTAAAGNVRVAFAPGASCNVDISASGGKIENALKLAESTAGSGRRLTGRLNAGGPLVKIRAEGGSVRLAPAEAGLE